MANATDLTKAMNSTGTPTRSYRFSLREFFIIVALIATIIVFIIQQRRLSSVQAALSRYESSEVPTTLPADQVRIIMQPIIRLHHIKVLRYRIESISPHFAAMSDGQGGSNSGAALQDEKTGLYVSEGAVLVDHIESEKCVKLMARINGASGYSITKVPDNYSLDDSIVLKNVTGLFPRNQSVELFTWNGKTYTLDVK